MTGSALVPIIVPIVAMAALAVWLGMVIYADRHPQPGAGPLPGQQGTAPAAGDAGLPAPRPQAAPAEPARPAAVPGPAGARSHPVRPRPHRRAARGKASAGHPSR